MQTSWIVLVGTGGTERRARALLPTPTTQLEGNGSSSKLSYDTTCELIASGRQQGTSLPNSVVAQLSDHYQSLQSDLAEFGAQSMVRAVAVGDQSDALTPTPSTASERC